MKKFLSMFFMLSVLPTIGLAVDAKPTPYEVTDIHNTNIANIDSETDKNNQKIQYKNYCNNLLNFTNKYNLHSRATINGNSYSIQTNKDCESLVNKKGGMVVAAFADDIHWQIQDIQKQEVKRCCNLGDNCGYKTVDDSHGYTAKDEPTVTCSATANDERCLLTQKLENRGLTPTTGGYDKKYYYSCNRPKLVFSDRFISINNKDTQNICGINTQNETTAGFIDSRIQLTLADFDSDCNLTDSDIKKLAEGTYAAGEEEALIQKINIRRK